MEFVEGETWRRCSEVEGGRAGDGHPFGKKDDVRYFANLAEAFGQSRMAIQQPTRSGSPHRDIKPIEPEPRQGRVGSGIRDIGHRPA
jgi:hypothetical protein